MPVTSAGVPPLPSALPSTVIASPTETFDELPIGMVGRLEASDELDERDVVLGVVADHLDLVRRAGAVDLGRDVHGAVDDVVVGEHLTVRRDDHSGSGDLARAARDVGVDVHDRGVDLRDGGRRERATGRRHAAVGVLPAAGRATGSRSIRDGDPREWEIDAVVSAQAVPPPAPTQAMAKAASAVRRNPDAARDACGVGGQLGGPHWGSDDQ